MNQYYYITIGSLWLVQKSFSLISVLYSMRTRKFLSLSCDDLLFSSLLCALGLKLYCERIRSGRNDCNTWFWFVKMQQKRLRRIPADLRPPSTHLLGSWCWLTTGLRHACSWLSLVRSFVAAVTVTHILSVTVLLQRDRNLWGWQNCGCGSGEPVPFRRLRDLPPGCGSRGLISFSLGSRAGWTWVTLRWPVVKWKRTNGLFVTHSIVVFFLVMAETMGTINKDGIDFLNDLGRRITQSTHDHCESTFLLQRYNYCDCCLGYRYLFPYNPTRITFRRSNTCSSF